MTLGAHRKVKAQIRESHEHHWDVDPKTHSVFCTRAECRLRFEYA